LYSYTKPETNVMVRVFVSALWLDFRITVEGIGIGLWKSFDTNYFKNCTINYRHITPLQERLYFQKSC